MNTRTRQFLIFFSIVLTLYALLNAYLYFHVHAFAAMPAARGCFTGVFLFLAASYLAGRLLERFHPGALSAFLVWIGAFWLGAMTYFFLLALLLDLVQVVVWIAGVQDRWSALLTAHGRLGGLAAAGLVACLLLAGYLNARNPRLRRVPIAVGKALPGGAPLRVALASDIHLGTIICRRRLRRMVERINSVDADLVLLAGDVIDEDLRPVIEQNLGEELRRIRSRHGVFAVNGNHEWIGGAERADAYLEEHGVTVLRDAVAEPLPGVLVIGREDRSARQFAGRRRAPLADLVAALPAHALRILMDHQPMHLDEAEAQGIDLQLSGHTHHGQLWPFQYITRKVYEISRGYGRRGDTQYYVSSGAGTWGPPIRLGNTPEIVLLHITGTPLP
jgi:uncharacterized protein